MAAGDSMSRELPPSPTQGMGSNGGALDVVCWVQFTLELGHVISLQDHCVDLTLSKDNLEFHGGPVWQHH